MNDLPEPVNGTPASGDWPVERQRLEEQVRELTAANERLKAELDDMRLQCDDYLGALRAVAPEFVFTREDLEKAVPSGPWFDELLESLRGPAGGKTE